MIRNLLVVIISPKVGWQYIDRSGHSTQRVLAGIFYPLLCILAVSAFVPMVYDSTEHPLPTTLMEAIVAFSKFMITYFLCSYLLSGFYPQFARSQVAMAKLNSYLIYNLSFMIILSILINLLPGMFSPLYFLFLYMPFMAHKALEYLDVSQNSAKANKFILISTLMMLFMPLFFGWILNTIINH